jgi:hypothetical protein
MHKSPVRFNRAMGGDGDVVDLADALTAVIKQHAAAVAGGTPLRQELGPQLIDALNAYGAAVANSSNDEDEDVDDDVAAELGTFDAWLDDEDGVVHDDEADDEPFVALFVRVDIEVKDAELLREQALDKMQKCCPEILEADGPEGHVGRDADAVSTLIGHGEHPLSAWFREHGMEVRAEASVAVPVTGLNASVEDPFALLVRMLEEETADQ